MRQIKFRGKNIHTGEWLYGDYHREGKVHYIAKPEQYLREYAPIEFIVNANTIGQFIIKTPKDLDKFGADGNYAKFIEIYEDDIVEARCKFGYADGYKGYAVNVGDRFVVTSYAAGFCAVPIDLYNSWVEHGRIPNTCRVMSNYYLWNSHRFFTPIGSIHDTPELLNEKER